jgi:hypothetical protein
VVAQRDRCADPDVAAEAEAGPDPDAHFIHSTAPLEPR